MRMYHRLLAAIVAVLMLADATRLAVASNPEPAPRAQNESVSFDLPVLGPFAYVHFCVRYPDDCRIRGRAFRRPRAVQLDRQHWADIVQINEAVNRSITPRAYLNDTTYDTWRVAPLKGDCNDFAVTKRHELLTRGWPSRAVLLSEVVTSWGEHHLVLLVRTDRGDFVLDNLRRQVRRWSVAGYQWVRVQSPTNPSLWSTIAAPGRGMS